MNYFQIARTAVSIVQKVLALHNHHGTGYVVHELVHNAITVAHKSISAEYDKIKTGDEGK